MVSRTFVLYITYLFFVFCFQKYIVTTERCGDLHVHVQVSRGGGGGSVRGKTFSGTDTNKMSAIICLSQQLPSKRVVQPSSVGNTRSAGHEISCHGTERGERSVQIMKLSIMLHIFLLL
jgi:hypothetical protein